MQRKPQLTAALMYMIYFEKSFCSVYVQNTQNSSVTAMSSEWQDPWTPAECWLCSAAAKQTVVDCNAAFRLQVSTSRESLDEQSQLAGQRFERGLTADLVPDTASVMPEEPAFQMPASKVDHGAMH